MNKLVKVFLGNWWFCFADQKYIIRKTMMASLSKRANIAYGRVSWSCCQVGSANQPLNFSLFSSLPPLISPSSLLSYGHELISALLVCTLSSIVLYSVYYSPVRILSRIFFPVFYFVTENAWRALKGQKLEWKWWCLSNTDDKANFGGVCFEGRWRRVRYFWWCVALIQTKQRCSTNFRM